MSTITSYRMGHHKMHHTSRRKRVLWLLIILLVAVVAGVGWFLLSQQVQQPGASVEASQQQAISDANPMQHIDESVFTLNLPADWKPVIQADTGHYRWESTKRETDNRSLDLYVDTVPMNAAYTRLLPVAAQTNRIITGEVSDNCGSFAGPTMVMKSQTEDLPDTPAKWNGVPFICTFNKPNNTLIGTGSTAAGQNKVLAAGPTTGQHALFFLYVDERINPDISIFTQAVTSFRLK